MKACLPLVTCLDLTSATLFPLNAFSPHLDRVRVAEGSLGDGVKLVDKVAIETIVLICRLAPWKGLHP
jgi:hypothetical protein